MEKRSPRQSYKEKNMSRLIKEILDMVALPYEWLDDERCVFEFNGKKFGIFAEYLELKLSPNVFDIVNILFGTYEKEFNENEDLNLDLTNFGKPRTILSTVSEACIANRKIINSDIICLAASDQVKNKRSIIYSLALSEIRTKVKEFNHANDIELKTDDGANIVLLSKVEFSNEEKEYISKELGLTK